MYGQNDLNWLSTSIGQLYAAKTIQELSRVSTAMIDARFSLTASTVEEFSEGVSSYTLHRIRSSVRPPKDFAAYLHDNPVGQFMYGGRSPPVIHLRQMVAFSQWCRTDHYNGVAKPTCFSDQMILVAQSRPTFGAVSLFRDSVFSANERFLSGLLQPHMVAAWARVKALTHVDRAGPMRISLSLNLRPIFLSKSVRQVFTTYFPDWRDADILPTAVSNWARHSIGKLSPANGNGPLRALAVESIRGKLMIRCFPNQTGSEVHLVMLEIPSIPSFLRLKGLGLTMRECEVMHWISQGKRDAEIAQILGVSPKTIGKHLENTLRKLSVANRTTALSRSYEWLEGEAGRKEHLEHD